MSELKNINQLTKKNMIMMHLNLKTITKKTNESQHIRNDIWIVMKLVRNKKILRKSLNLLFWDGQWWLWVVTLKLPVPSTLIFCRLVALIRPFDVGIWILVPGIVIVCCCWLACVCCWVFCWFWFGCWPFWCDCACCCWNTLWKLCKLAG